MSKSEELDEAREIIRTQPLGTIYISEGEVLVKVQDGWDFHDKNAGGLRASDSIVAGAYLMEKSHGRAVWFS